MDLKQKSFRTSENLWKSKKICGKWSNLCLCSDISPVSTWIPRRISTICGFSTRQRWKKFVFLLVAMCHYFFFASECCAISIHVFCLFVVIKWMKIVLFRYTEWGNLLPAVHSRICRHLAEPAAAGFRQSASLVRDRSRFGTTPESASGGAAAGNREVPDHSPGQVWKGKRHLIGFYDAVWNSDCVMQRDRCLIPTF